MEGYRRMKIERKKKKKKHNNIDKYMFGRNVAFSLVMLSCTCTDLVVGKQRKMVYI